MRKRYWVVLAFLALGGLGNLIGGTDTPGRAAVDPAGSVRAPVSVTAAPQFDAVLYVTAGSLNLREGPGTGARVLTSLPRNTRVLAGERRGGWVMVSVNGQVGWVSGDYLGGTPAIPALSIPAQGPPRSRVVQQQNAASCSPRLYCTQIGSCPEARWYLANCSWGGRLDGDGDGVPCEAICR